MSLQLNRFSLCNKVLSNLSLGESTMAMKDTIAKLRAIATDLNYEFEKALEGNKSAAQRARAHTLQFAKLAKIYRKESIAAFKKGGAKKGGAKRKAPGKKKSARKKKR